MGDTSTAGRLDLVHQSPKPIGQVHVARLVSTSHRLSVPGHACVQG